MDAGLSPDSLVSEQITQINPALETLGVIPQRGRDAFDTLVLGRYRSMPESFEKYVDLAE